MLTVFLHDWEGNTLGELSNIQNRRLTVGLNQSSSFSFDMPLLDNPIAAELFENASADLSQDQERDYRIVSVWRKNGTSNSIIFSGPIIMARDGVQDGDIPTANFTCSGPFWRLGSRIANDLLTGAGRTASGLTAYGERGQIAAGLIDYTNEYEGNTWIRPTTIDETDVISITNWGGFKTISQAIIDLSGEGSLNGFDWKIAPTIDEDSYGLILGRLSIRPIIGADKTSTVVFEYGTGQHNVESAYRSRSLETFANKAIHLSSGNTPYLVDAEDTTSITNRGLFEAIADGDLIDEELRQSWVDLNVALRSRPRRLYEITPSRSDATGQLGSSYRPLIDYDIGDVVRARIAYSNDFIWDMSIRIYSIDIAWSDAGEEKASLGLYLD